jgi:rod shape-determining protein MreD
MLKTAIILAAVLIEAALSDFWTWNGARPDFVLMLVIYSGLLGGPLSGLFNGLAGGIFMGFFSDYPMAILALSYGFTGWISGVIRERIFTDTPLIAFLSAGLLTLLHLGFNYLLLLFSGGNTTMNTADLWWRILLLNLFFSLPVYYLFRRLFLHGKKQA